MTLFGQPFTSSPATAPPESHGALQQGYGVRKLLMSCPQVLIVLSDERIIEFDLHSGSFATSMCQLNHDVLRLAMSELDNLPERLDLAIFPQAGIFRSTGLGLADIQGRSRAQRHCIENEQDCLDNTNMRPSGVTPVASTQAIPGPL